MFQILCLPFLAHLNFIAAAPTSSNTSHSVVSIKNGSYYGVHNNHYYQDFFLGVPFAQPSVGEVRLRPPMSQTSSWDALRNATEYGYAYIGYGEDTVIGGGNYVSEDCMTLSIVRPSGYENEKLPVGVWIYGFVLHTLQLSGCS
jgi:carboxylesterase type B